MADPFDQFGPPPEELEIPTAPPASLTEVAPRATVPTQYGPQTIPPLPPMQGGEAGRLGLETAGGVVGGTVGGLVARRVPIPGAAVVGTRVGEAAGVFGASLLSEMFDPSEDPVGTARRGALFTLATGLVTGGGAALLRKAVGQPDKAGRALQAKLEAAGVVPPVGAVLPEESAMQAIEKIAMADMFYGKVLNQHVQEAGGVVTQGLRRELASYLRVKRAADNSFKQWDDLVAKTLGNNDIVNVSPEVLQALKTIGTEWDRAGVLPIITRNNPELATVLRTQQTNVPFPVSISTAESLRSLLNARAVTEAAREFGQMRPGQVAGMTTSRAFRLLAEDVSKSLDTSIDVAIRNNAIPAAARAELVAGRQLWRRWKQGEMIREELRIPAQAARREDPRFGVLDSAAVFSAIDNLENLSEKLGYRVISSEQRAGLTTIARQLKSIERTKSSGAFQFYVRGSQVLLILGGGATLSTEEGGTAGAGVGALALAPPVLAAALADADAVRFILRGMRAKPGSAVAMRATRNLLSLAAERGWIEPEAMPPEEGSTLDIYGVQPFTPTPIVSPPSPSIPSPLRGGGAPEDPFSSGE